MRPQPEECVGYANLAAGTGLDLLELLLPSMGRPDGLLNPEFTDGLWI